MTEAPAKPLDYAHPLFCNGALAVPLKARHPDGHRRYAIETPGGIRAYWFNDQGQSLPHPFLTLSIAQKPA